MTVVTVFRSRLRHGVLESYLDVADEMDRAAEQMDGFMDRKVYTAPDGERVSIVRFRDHASQEAWAKHAEHRVAQERGRSEFYAWYDIIVADETVHHEFTWSGDGETA